MASQAYEDGQHPFEFRGFPNDSTEEWLADLKTFRSGVSRFMLSYQFGIDEVMTKVGILKKEFEHLHDYSPIEHVASRLKTPESMVDKAHREAYDLSFDNLRARMQDIAGVRITCSFISDTYRVADMLSSQADVTVIKVKDYIANPKPNGYKSLHLIITIPIFLSTGVEEIPVEIQIRTIAMDFWASLEHKIYYKFKKDVPDELLGELREAADVANRLDLKMERIHDEVHRGDTWGAGRATLSGRPRDQQWQAQEHDRRPGDVGDDRSHQAT